MYFKLKDYKNSIEYFENAKRIFEIYFDKTNYNIINCLTRMSMTYVEANKFNSHMIEIIEEKDYTDFFYNSTRLASYCSIAENNYKLKKLSFSYYFIVIVRQSDLNHGCSLCPHKV